MTWTPAARVLPAAIVRDGFRLRFPEQAPGCVCARQSVAGRLGAVTQQMRGGSSIRSFEEFETSVESSRRAPVIVEMQRAAEGSGRFEACSRPSTEEARYTCAPLRWPKVVRRSTGLTRCGRDRWSRAKSAV